MNSPADKRPREPNQDGPHPSQPHLPRNMKSDPACRVAAAQNVLADQDLQIAVLVQRVLLLGRRVHRAERATAYATDTAGDDSDDDSDDERGPCIVCSEFEVKATLALERDDHRCSSCKADGVRCDGGLGFYFADEHADWWDELEERRHNEETAWVGCYCWTTQ